MSFKKFNFEKPDDLYKKRKNDNKRDSNEKDIVDYQKVVEAFHTFIKIEFIQEKTKTVQRRQRSSFKNCWSYIRNSRNDYRTLMHKKKVWYKKKNQKEKKEI